MANAKTWYNNFIGYYSNNKKNFDKFLASVKRNKAEFRTTYLEEYNQNVNLLNEQYKDNVTPFQKLLTDKAINDASVKITKDKNQQQLLNLVWRHGHEV